MFQGHRSCIATVRARTCEEFRPTLIWFDTAIQNCHHGLAMVIAAQTLHAQASGSAHRHASDGNRDLNLIDRIRTSCSARNVLILPQNTTYGTAT
eukprot:1643726-Rhodomonas_salina.1